jgi:hypothetical protein
MTPTGRDAPYYPVLHLVGLCIILAFRGKLADYVMSEDKRRLSMGVALSSYPATMAGQMMGNLIFIIFIPTPVFYMSLLPITALERITITILSTVIATPLIIVIRSVFPKLIEA